MSTFPQIPWGIPSIRPAKRAPQAAEWTLDPCYWCPCSRFALKPPRLPWLAPKGCVFCASQSFSFAGQRALCYSSVRRPCREQTKGASDDGADIGNGIGLRPIAPQRHPSDFRPRGVHLCGAGIWVARSLHLQKHESPLRSNRRHAREVDGFWGGRLRRWTTTAGGASGRDY